VIRSKESQYEVGLVNAVDSPWAKVDLLGRILNRDEALEHPWVRDAFCVTDHMVAEDPAIVQFFCGAPNA
jgi:hypothetical protein